jgi:polyhydroxyalkanoate synthesis regulator phasin
MIKFFVKLKSDIFIEIKNFIPEIKKGKIKNQSKHFLKDILKEHRIKSGWIAANRKKVSFRNVPPEAHQKIRNVIRNDHKYYF